MDQPQPPRPDSDPEDVLRRLEARLDRASEAAERLLGEAASRLGGAADPPPRATEHPPHADPEHPPDADPDHPPAAGWQIPGQDGPAPGRDLDLLIGVVQSLRDRIPDDLQRRLSEALRELLLAVRALIDWYLERMERRRAEPAEVQDIPIE
jgi:hypothetical protein